MNISQIARFVERKHKIKKEGEYWIREPFTPTNYKKVPLTDRDYIFSPVNLWDMHHTQIDMDRYHILFTYTNALKDDLEHWESVKKTNHIMCKKRRKRYEETKRLLVLVDKLNDKRKVLKEKERKELERLKEKNRKFLEERKEREAAIRAKEEEENYQELITLIGIPEPKPKPKPKPKKPNVETRVLAVLQKYRAPLTLKDIAKRAKCSAGSVSFAKSILIAKGHIIERKKHSYMRSFVYKLIDQKELNRRAKKKKKQDEETARLLKLRLLRTKENVWKAKVRKKKEKRLARRKKIRQQLLREMHRTLQARQYAAAARRRRLREDKARQKRIEKLEFYNRLKVPGSLRKNVLNILTVAPQPVKLKLIRDVLSLKAADVWSLIIQLLDDGHKIKSGGKGDTSDFTYLGR